jgi:hypothetical protein
MGRYESYVFEVLSSTFGADWSRGDERIFSYGFDAGEGSVDGVLAGRIAVEVGVGSPKQIRSGLLDLVLHPANEKLLVLVDTPGHRTDRSTLQVQAIMDRLKVRGRVVRLAGSPSDPQPRSDADRLRTAIDELA